MHTSRRSIAIDMDGVLADTAAQFREWYYRESGVRLGPNAFDGVPEDECLPDGAVRRYLYQPNFFRTTPLVPGAQQAVAELMEHFDVYIVSAAMEFPNSLPEKLDWLREHFPFISWHNIVFCGSKAIIRTDYMVDDHVKNLDRFPGKTFLFTAPHNLQVRHHQRINSWEEAVRAIKTELAFSYRGNSL